MNNRKRNMNSKLTPLLWKVKCRAKEKTKKLTSFWFVWELLCSSLWLFIGVIRIRSNHRSSASRSLQLLPRSPPKKVDFIKLLPSSSSFKSRGAPLALHLFLPQPAMCFLSIGWLLFYSLLSRVTFWLVGLNMARTHIYKQCN